MNVLVLQLKRIGDLVLTTPALAALREHGVHVTLVVDGPCGSLLPAIAGLEESHVFHKGGDNCALWTRLRDGGWDACLDFTGSDRSALMGWLSRTPRRITFDWVRKRLLRRIAYHEFVASPVRLAHTCDHTLDLVRALAVPIPADTLPTLELPREARESAHAMLGAAGIHGTPILIHPGSARPEKYWLAERWAAVIARLHALGHACAITCGPDAFEKAHATAILSLVRAAATKGAVTELFYPPDLLTLAALVETSRLVLSCDTAVVHLAAAFRKPQVALFGPTNPFHWRPRHDLAVVISATQPEEPLTQFQPKMKGAATANIPTSTVLRAAEELLAVAMET